MEQIQTNFVSLLLHLNEGDPVVVAVSFKLPYNAVVVTGDYVGL